MGFHGTWGLKKFIHVCHVHMLIKGLEVIASIKFAFGSYSWKTLNMWPREVSIQVKKAIIGLKKKEIKKNILTVAEILRVAK